MRHLPTAPLPALLQPRCAAAISINPVTANRQTLGIRIERKKRTMNKTFALTLAAFALVGLTACDVKKTQEGNVTLPKYEVEKTQSGDVTLPKYDVKTPDVNVTTEPKVIEVPKIEITPAK